MKILIACDSFKDALSAERVCQRIADGLRLAAPDVQTHLFPLADGGEGTFEIFQQYFNAKIIRLTVNDPLFRPVEAHYGLFETTNNSVQETVAFIEMAQAAGLQRLSLVERDPSKTTTFGVGEMIRDAIQRGATRLILAIGGSATNDAGIGMAAALGYVFLDEMGDALLPVGGHLSKIKTIVPPTNHFNTIKTDVVCDVINPLFGASGAAYIYARQKGADDTMIAELDKGLAHFASVGQHFDASIDPTTEGAGAAGGLGFGTMLFLNAQLRRGIELVLDLLPFDTALQTAQLVITGEGRLDSQTAQGKLIGGVCRRARQYNVPVIALCGSVDAPPQLLDAIGLQAAFSINSQLIPLEVALRDTGDNLEKTAFNVMRLIQL